MGDNESFTIGVIVLASAVVVFQIGFYLSFYLLEAGKWMEKKSWRVVARLTYGLTCCVLLIE